MVINPWSTAMALDVVAPQEETFIFRSNRLGTWRRGQGGSDVWQGEVILVLRMMTVCPWPHPNMCAWPTVGERVGDQFTYGQMRWETADRLVKMALMQGEMDG